MISVEDALSMVLEHTPLLPEEQVPLLSALGRPLSRPAFSDMDIAPFDNSAMDGFALRSTDVGGERVVVDRVLAGGVPVLALGPGQATRIMTGAPIPQGADAVAMVEVTRVLEGDGGVGSRILVQKPVAPGENIRRRAEDVREGACVLEAGAVVTPAAVGLLAATGNPMVWVRRRPRVAVLSTGDELVAITARPGPGQIRNSNSSTLAAQVMLAGGEPVMTGTVADTEAATEAAFLEASRWDLVVTSGGVSVGDHDHVRPLLERLGRILFHRVDMRPGQPQTFGVLGDRQVPFFGLPGNPTSAFLGFELFARPALRALQGYRALARPRVQAVLDRDLKKKADTRYFHRAILAPAPTGWSVDLAGSQSSALLSPAVRANALMDLPAGPGHLPRGSTVTCIRMDVPEEAL